MYFLLCLYLYTRWYLVSLPVWFKLKDNGCAVVCDMSLLSRPCLVETIGAAFNRFIGGVRGEQHCLTFATTLFYCLDCSSLCYDESCALFYIPTPF